MDSMKQYLFSAKKNFAINKIKEALNWVLFNIPDFSIVDGWKMWLLRAVFFLYCIALVGWLFAEGITPQSIIIRAVLASAFVAVIYSNLIAAICYTFVCKWETFENKQLKMPFHK